MYFIPGIEDQFVIWRWRKPNYVFFLFFLLFVYGCGGPTKPVMQFYEQISGQSYCRIALLPFVNETSYLEGDTIIYKIFESELINSDNFIVSQEGDVHKVYRQLAIYPGKNPNHEQLRIIGDRLDADLLVEGKIVEMSQGPNIRAGFPVLGINLRVYDARKGTTIWTTYYKRQGNQYRKVMHFGLVNTINALAQRMSNDIINAWFEAGLQKCVDS